MNSTSVCRNLRTKKMFIPALAQETAVDENDYAERSSHCWCNCTLTEVGPDDRPVGQQVCTAARPCFRE